MFNDGLAFLNPNSNNKLTNLYSWTQLPRSDYLSPASLQSGLYSPAMAHSPAVVRISSRRDTPHANPKEEEALRFASRTSAPDVGVMGETSSLAGPRSTQGG